MIMRLPVFACVTASVIFMAQVMAGSVTEKAASYDIEDFGTHGHLFDIKEVSLLAEIMGKLKEAEKNGKLKELNEQFIAKVREKVLRPVAVAGIKNADKRRSWTYDPTYVQLEDIRDDKRRVLIAAGTTINPLDKLKWGKKVILIDGDSSRQVSWAKSQDGIITLVRGAPHIVAKELNRRVYFDQGGYLCKKFRIQAVPAIIEQDGHLLRITEEAI